ncbi:hypothetical protein [Sphingopyxis fribergensis]
MPTVQIPCNFVGQFKVGDNLRYNCDLLCALAASNVDSSFNKMIVLQAGSILEAALIEIIFRAQNYNLEGVPNIDPVDRQRIEELKIDKFAVTIDVLRKYNVLNGARENVYDDLHRLRKYRNKVHIQEDVKIAGAPRDEEELFTDILVNWSITLNREVLQFLSEHLSRPAHIHGYVGDLEVPA